MAYWRCSISFSWIIGPGTDAAGFDTTWGRRETLTTRDNTVVVAFYYFHREALIARWGYTPHVGRKAMAALVASVVWCGVRDV